MLLLVIWAVLMVVAFALIYHGLGPRFQADRGSIDFGTLLYMSGSTFLTLGLGDVTSTDSLGRMFMILEAATGLHLPRSDHHLHAAAGPGLRAREVGSLLLHSRAGRPPGAISFCTATPAPIASRSSGATCARASAGWPRLSRPTSPTPCCAFIGRNTTASRGWSL